MDEWRTGLFRFTRDGRYRTLSASRGWSWWMGDEEEGMEFQQQGEYIDDR